MSVRNKNGFTLIEVMISMFIMATLTVLVSTSIRTAVQNKRKLELHMKSETALYDTLRVIKMDIEKAFNYQDVFFEIEKLALEQLEIEKGKAKGGGGGQPAPARVRPKKLTHFLGENDKLNFTTLNHFRTQYNAQESNQMEVGYYVDSCKNQDGKGSSNCLWRRASTLIDDDIEEGGSKVALAENVSNFKISYRSDKENEEWAKDWFSNQKGKPQNRNKFPHLVKIELAIGEKGDKKIKPVKQTMIVRIEFTNNEPLLSRQPAPRKAAPQ